MKRLYQSGLALLLMASLAACDALQNAQEEQELNEEVAREVAEVVAQSLADQSDGMMTDLYDATATFDQRGMYYLTGSVVSKNGDEVQNPRYWRGMRRGFRVDYDSTTGTFTIHFVHEVTRPNFRKSIEALLKYIFKDKNGQFIARPRAERNRIASIDFEGYRKGSVAHRTPSGNERSASFERRATWHVEGLEAESDTITFEGEQEMEGARHFVNREGQEVEQEFRARLVTDGPIVILKPSATDSLEHLTYGTLAYEVRMVKRTGDKEVVHEVEGTIEMNGDGSALVRFYGVPQTYRIFLSTGEVKRES
ncbi:hypothetical protein [Rhodothermus profundi]|uniref:Outer membrane lipoprotein-sorting protein n=1 Tax=Rhodothermus profundi TaxID=633813 RepID=A0A1M6TJJ6_9BACT|nr:hypothetical protein [Rhodothermus profundi]SHK57252.1 hypothetical protein SAMN04488087_1427 [Rhodothermus profundi]